MFKTVRTFVKVEKMHARVRGHQDTEPSIRVEIVVVDDLPKTPEQHGVVHDLYTASKPDDPNLRAVV